MTATHPDFLLYSGSTWEFDAALHDAACNPLDLTDAQIAWRLYDSRGNIKLELTPDNGITVTSMTGGLITISPTAAQTTALAQGSYRDEIVVTLPSGYVDTQAVGSIIVQQPGSLPAPATGVQDPCATLATLQAARIALASGQATARVKIEGFEVWYSLGDMGALNRLIAQYDTACRKATGRGPRRFAIGSGGRRPWWAPYSY